MTVVRTGFQVSAGMTGGVGSRRTRDGTDGVVSGFGFRVSGFGFRVSGRGARGEDIVAGFQPVRE